MLVLDMGDGTRVGNKRAGQRETGLHLVVAPAYAGFEVLIEVRSHWEP